MVAALALAVLTGSAGAAPMREAALDVDSCGVDDFTGEALDTGRWTVLRPSSASPVAVAGGQLRLRALTGDLFGDRDTAQNVVLQDAPSGAWTATTQLDTSVLTVEGQQSGIVVRKDGETFSKFVFINKGSGNRRFEHIFTAGQQARLENADFTDTLAAGFPAVVKLRVISDGETVRGEYADGDAWKPIGRPAKIGAGAQVGLYAADNAADGPVVPYDFFALNAQDDEFAGETLEKCRWSQIVREDAGGYRVVDGALAIDTSAGEVGDTAKNLIGQPVPAGAWEAETKVDLTTALEGQQAGLLLYGAPDNFAKVVLVDKGAASQVEFVRVKDGAYQLDEPFKVDVPATLTSFQLRLRSNGSTATAEYSADGAEWTQVGKARDISDLGAGHLGPMALHGGAASPVTAEFDYVRVKPSPVAACPAPGAPEDGFARLWNGVDLAGTAQAGPGGFDVVEDAEQGCHLVSRGGMGMLWFNAKTYDNFVLRLQFKTADATDNSGVFVRFPNPGTDPWVAINQGHEIQIREGEQGDGENQKTGSVYNFDREDARAAKPVGEWNDYELRYENHAYTITLNGTVVNTWANSSSQARAAGYIGLQNHGTDDEVSFRNLRIQELGSATNLFTTIGITRSETRMNSQINGNPPYSLPADEMPASNTVATPEQDSADDVPLRMPDTSGEKPNLAEFRGQTLTLDPADQKPFSKLHFFGTTADGSGGGTFVLTYEGGDTEEVDVAFPDWCAEPSGNAHIAIGRMTKRYRASPGGQDGAPCSIFHVEVENPVTDKKLVSVTLPEETDGSGTATRAYLMALTLQEASGSYELPNLTGVNQFPNDNTAPESGIEIAPAEPSPTGWFTTAPRVTIEAADEDGGSGVEQVQYRINGGATQFYSEPFDLTAEGEIKLEYRSIDRAGNAEPFKALDLKVDATDPATTATTYPGKAAEGGWHDQEVTVSLRATDGVGSGTTATSYQVNDGAWTRYSGPFQVARAGDNVVRYRSTDAAGNEETARELRVRVDVTAPTTAVRLNGSAPGAAYTGAVRVTFTRDDGDGSGATATEYRVDGGEWTPYTGFFDVSGNRGHKVDYRSADAAGNVENYKSVIFSIYPPVLLPAPVPQAQPAPAPKQFAAVEEVSSRLRTLSALRRGRLKVNVSCVGVTRGTLTLTVDRSVARKLKLKRRTLTRKVVRCGDEGRTTVSLRPSAAVRRALARSKGSVKAKLTLRMTGAATDTQTVTFRGKA